PPAISAQHTCVAAGCSARSRATTACAAARSGTGCTQAMKRLLRTSNSACAAAARVKAMQRPASAPLEAEDRRARARVGQPAHLAAVLQAEGIEDAQAVLAREDLEVLESADADVGRVVPLVGQPPRDRHAPARHADAV